MFDAKTMFGVKKKRFASSKKAHIWNDYVNSQELKNVSQYEDYSTYLSSKSLFIK